MHSRQFINTSLSEWMNKLWVKVLGSKNQPWLTQAEQGFIRRIWGSSQNQHKDQRIKLCTWTATKGSQAGGTMARAASQEYPAKDTSAGTTAARGWCPWHGHHWPLAAVPLFFSATALLDHVTWLYSFKIQSPRQECPAGWPRVDCLPSSCQKAGESRYLSRSAEGHAATCFQMNLLK